MVNVAEGVCGTARKEPDVFPLKGHPQDKRPEVD